MLMLIPLEACFSFCMKLTKTLVKNTFKKWRKKKIYLCEMKVKLQSSAQLHFYHGNNLSCVLGEKLWAKMCLFYIIEMYCASWLDNLMLVSTLWHWIRKDFFFFFFKFFHLGLAYKFFQPAYPNLVRYQIFTVVLNYIKYVAFCLNLTRSLLRLLVRWL